MCVCVHKRGREGERQGEGERRERGEERAMGERESKRRKRGGGQRTSFRRSLLSSPMDCLLIRNLSYSRQIP